MALKILIVGCGDIGTPLGLQLAAAGHQVWGLRRSSLLPAPLKTINADVTVAATLSVLADLSFDCVVMTLTPAAFSDAGYEQVFNQGLLNVLQRLKQPLQIKRLFFISSTSVYHQSDGQWVDEYSPVEPVSFSGKRLLQAEQSLVASGIAFSIIRFAGIYGPGRQRLLDQVMSGQGSAKTPSLYTNRIHRDDCVGFLAHLVGKVAQGKSVEPCYIGVDSQPVTMWELKRWLAQQLGVDPERLTQEESSRRNSKRCSNKRLLATGYQLQYPGYQSGYTELIKAYLNSNK